MRRIAICFAASALALAACGGGGSTVTPDAGGTTPGPAATGAAGQKPAVEIPAGDPPKTLKIEDVTVGTGAEAVAGKTVRVHYVGVAWSTKRQFDASWDGGQPFEFALGAGQVIDGWDEGVAGMKVGGRRRLTIPPDKGYGAAGSPPAIAPNETLVFVVDLLAVR